MHGNVRYITTHACLERHLLWWELRGHCLKADDVAEEDGDAVKRLGLHRAALP